MSSRKWLDISKSVGSFLLHHWPWRLKVSDLFIADVWNQFARSLSARVRVSCLIGLLLPPVASESSYKGHYSSRLGSLEVLSFNWLIASMFTENPLFETSHVWKRHCDVIRWPIFTILVSMERGDPTLYHGTKQTYFGPVKFKFIRGVVTTPLGKPCYKKRLGRTRVKHNIKSPLHIIFLSYTCNILPQQVFLEIYGM